MIVEFDSVKFKADLFDVKYIFPPYAGVNIQNS